MQIYYNYFKKRGAAKGYAGSVPIGAGLGQGPRRKIVMTGRWARAKPIRYFANGGSILTVGMNQATVSSGRDF